MRIWYLRLIVKLLMSMKQLTIILFDLSGYISVDGHIPSSDDPLWTNVFVYAPLCRYAEDLPLVFAASIHNKEKLKELRLNEPVSAVR